MAQQLSHYTATSASAAALPSPPRIPIPSPLIDSDSISGTEYIYDRSPNAKPIYGRVLGSGSLHWNYDARHTAQEILPTLWIGPTTIAKNITFLKAHGITLLIGLHGDTLFTRAAQAATLAAATSLSIESTSIVTPTSQSLIAALPQIESLISSHLSASSSSGDDGNKSRVVLIHCETGNERCPTAAAAYLMSSLRDTDHMRAMAIVQSQRFSANFDEERKGLLQCYWDLVRARRSTAGEPSSATIGQAVKRGREAFERDQDGDAAEADGAGGGAASTTGADDSERFEGREHAPFVDSVVVHREQEEKVASTAVTEVQDMDMGDA